MMRFVKKLLQLLVLVVLILALVVGGGWFWYTHRPLPAAITDQPLFQGVMYTRAVTDEPRPLVVHVIKIDLDAPGISFLVTPRDTDGDLPLIARTVSEFAGEHALQIAINGDFFEPWWSRALWDYYPHRGDPVGVQGMAASAGQRYNEGFDWRWSLHLSAANRVNFGQSLDEIYNVISGDVMILDAGAIPVETLAHEYHLTPHPRTVVALDRTAETLLLMVVDGRQPNYSEGITLPEAADLILEYGGWWAVNFDGGGSTTLVISDGAGNPQVVNSPIDNRIPGRERPVANHLGVRALPLVEVAGRWSGIYCCSKSGPEDKNYFVDRS